MYQQDEYDDGSQTEKFNRLVGNLDELKDNTELDQKIKQTLGKPPLGHLLEFNLALEEVVRVREYGKKKYPEAESWRQVPDNELDNAILRHMFNPNKKDNETGYSHTAHMIQNLLFKLQKEMENDSQ